MIPDLTILQTATYFTFILTFFGMAAGSIFFIANRTSLDGHWRTTSLVSGVITFVAAATYFYMKDIYIVGIASGERKFPTEFRYIDWFITVPLLLIKFPNLLGIGRKGLKFMTSLIVLSIIMLVTAFIGEVSYDNKTMHFTFYAMSCMAWVAIIWRMNFALSQLPPHITDAVRATVKRIFIFIFVGWLIYPIGYVMPSLGVEPDWRELIYNIGDLVNKVGLGLVVVYGAYAEKKEAAETEYEYVTE